MLVFHVRTIQIDILVYQDFRAQDQVAKAYRDSTANRHPLDNRAMLAQETWDNDHICAKTTISANNIDTIYIDFCLLNR